MILLLVLQNNILCFLLPFFFLKCSLNIGGAHIIHVRALYTGKYGNWGHWLKDKLATGIDSLVFLKLSKNVWSTKFFYQCN